MKLRRFYDIFRENIWPSVLNGYSCIFFNNSRLFGWGLMIATMLNPYAGLSGLLSALISVSVAYLMGFDRRQLSKGFYSFNAILVGLGMGTFFDPSGVYLLLLALASLFSLMISVTLGGWLGKYGLPYLSIPFVLAFWFVFLPSPFFENLGLTQRNVYWLNELYEAGGNFLLDLYRTIDVIFPGTMVDTYLRSLSSVVFQSNILAGFIIALLLLIKSPIAFSLSVTGFLTAFGFARFTGSELSAITYYNIGANYIMVAIAVGGYFIVPSLKSYVWSVAMIPLTAMLLLFMTKVAGIGGLPVFSLPFSLITVMFLYFLMMRRTPNGLYLTPFQHGSAEDNLYSFANSRSRLSNLNYFPLQLPFWGEWQVSQGYDGEHTHKDDWGNALDFNIVDEHGRSYKETGRMCDDYYCYGKPVLAPADGVVELIVDNISDNEPGAVDTVNNWGNTIIIRHFPDLYTQISHLKKGSFRFAKGDMVRRGDIVALCGNSGRSPEPHLHFQMQTLPYLGAKTLSYPFACYYKKDDLQFYSIPHQGDTVKGYATNALFREAFDIQPNARFRFRYGNQIEEWEAYTDAFNLKYLYSRQTGATAYFHNDASMFRFTAFHGSRSSLLYYFYLSTFKVGLGATDGVAIEDSLPLNMLNNNMLAVWLNNFVAPFRSLLKARYRIKAGETDDAYNPTTATLSSSVTVTIGKKRVGESRSSITFAENRITGFTYSDKKRKIDAIKINNT